MTNTLVWYKQTEVGLMPSNWEFSSIEDLSKSIKIWPFWSQLKKDLLVNNWPYKVYWQENIYEKNMELWDRYITKEHFQKLSSCELKKWDFVISMMWTIWKSMIVPENIKEWIMDSHLIRIRLKKIIKNEFMSYAFSSDWVLRQVNTLSVGWIMDWLSSKIIKQINIYYPKSISEQEKIATILSNIDWLISSLDEMIKKKKNIKIWAMQKLLTPKEWWFEKEFDEIISNFSTWLNPRDNFVLNTWWNNYYVTIKNFRDWKLYLDENCDKIDDIAMEKINKRSNLKKWDLLFSSIWRVWDAYVIKEDPKNRNINESVFSLTPNKKLITSDYLYYLIKSESVHNALTWNTTWSTLTSIKLNHLKKIRCSIPSTLEEQQAIATILSDMDNEIEALENKKAKYEQIKKWAMQQLLTGKIRLV